MSGTTPPIGVAFAGAGMVAELHERALRRLPQAKLVGLYEPDQHLAARRADEWGCTAFASFEALLEDDTVDCVLILAPFEAHEALALQAIAAGRHVLVEKPVAAADGIERLTQAATDQGLVCLPGHNYAYQPEFAQLRSLAREGSLGRVRALWITYAIAHPESVAARYAGVLDEVMVHHSYLALALLGAPRDLVAGRLEPAWKSHPAEDQAWMTWTWSGGTSAHLFASFAVGDETADPWTFVVKVLGERGSATYSWRNAVVQRPLGTLAIGLPSYEDSYVYELRALFAAIGGDDCAVVSPLEDALLTQRILAAADRSASAGATIRNPTAADSAPRA